jgi:hypothetical protein
VFNSIFRNGEQEDDVKKMNHINDENKNTTVLRKETFRVLSTQIVYDSEQDSYNTLATCVNQNDEIETVNINGFKVERGVTSLVGAFIDIEVTEDAGEEYYAGRIYTGFDSAEILPSNTYC